MSWREFQCCQTVQTVPGCAGAPWTGMANLDYVKTRLPEFLFLEIHFFKEILFRFVFCLLKWKKSANPWHTVHGVLELKPTCPKVHLIPSFPMIKTTRTQCAPLELLRRVLRAEQKTASQTASATRCRKSWRVMTGRWSPCPLPGKEGWRTNLTWSDRWTHSWCGHRLRARS